VLLNGSEKPIFTRAYILKKKFYTTLTYPELYDVDPSVNQEISDAWTIITPYSQLPSNLTNWTKVKVRTQRFIVPNGLFTPNPYALVTIDNQVFIEAVQVNQYDYQPHWTSIKFIPASQEIVNITYTLMFSKFPKDDESQNITGVGDGSFHGTFVVSSDRIFGEGFNGTYNTANTPLNVSANQNTVLLTFNHQQVGNCPTGGLPIPYCPDEAYTELHLYPRCGSTETLVASGEKLSVPIFAFLIFIYHYLL